MLIADFQDLIRNLPVRQQCGRTNRTTWQPFENLYPWLHQLNNEIFNNSTIVALSRQEVFNVQSNVRQLILKTILWGYLRGMRGNHFTNILAHIDILEQCLTDLSQIGNLNHDDFNKAVANFKQVPGLGLSTFSKLLYFLEISINNNPCLILDFRIVDTLGRNDGNTFDELAQLQNIRRHNAISYYVDYITICNEVANNLQTHTENIEQFIYIFGGSIKK